MRQVLSCIWVVLLIVPTLTRAEQLVVQLGPLEIEISDRAIEAVLCRDVFVFGDPHSNYCPVAGPVLLTDKWQGLASPEGERSRLRIISKDADGVVMAIEGEMVEREGSGRWQWRQDMTLSLRGQLTIEYICRQTHAPTKPARHHRFVFLLNRNEVLVRPKRGALTRKTPGQPLEITDVQGAALTRGFGEAPNHYDQPRRIAMPFQGRQVAVTVDRASRLELWNGGWAQRANLFLAPPGPEAGVTLTIDFSQLLDGQTPALTVEELVPRSRPWLAEEVPKRVRPARPLRFAQCTPAINCWRGQAKLDPDGTERMIREMAKHFDVVELFLAWADWKYGLGWDRDPRAKRDADALAAKAQEWVDIGLKHGVEMALSLNFGGAEPGTGKQETRRLPQFQAETFDPAAGTFHENRDVFDWTHPEGLAYARRAWAAAAGKIKSVGFLFFNEPHYRLKCWYRAPFFSQAALDDFRRFCGDPNARLPAKPYAKPTDRTDNSATQADWRRWEDWIASVYARRIRVQTEAVREANRDNPRYKGAIWFQNVSWVGPEWGTDLDVICALPEVQYIVCEYCTSEASENWRKFRYFAHKHGKKLSSFVNVCYYDQHAKGRHRFEGTDDSFRRAVQMGVRENADMLSLYWCGVMYPWHEAHHPARTRIWDEVTKPYCLGPR